MTKQTTKITTEAVEAAAREVGLTEADITTRKAAQIACLILGTKRAPKDQTALVLSHLQAIGADLGVDPAAMDDVDDVEIDEDEEAAIGSSKVKQGYKEKYARNALKHTCDDAFAYAFADATGKAKGPALLDLLVEIGTANDIDVEARWGHLQTRGGTPNYGMMRMNLSNVLRSRAKKGEAVTVGEKVWEAAEEE